MSTYAGSDGHVLKATGLNTFYGKSQVLFDLSIAIPERGLVAILGRNGAGKTTLLNTLVGELRPPSGNILFAGRNVVGDATEMRVRAGMAYVPQEQPVFAQLTVRDNLTIGALLSPTGGFDHVLSIFPKLFGRLDQIAGTLSGGERKMLAIARAMLGGPKILMLDEPTEGVWIGVVEEIADRLTALSKDIAVVLVEQNLDLALRIADKVLVLDRGQVALSGTPDVIRHDPQLAKLLAP